MVTYDDEDVDLEMPILIYGKSLNHSAITKTYASFVERELYDTFNLDELRKSIPTSETAKYNTAKDNTEFIYTVLDPDEAKEEQYYLFVSVTADIEGEIMLLTSMPMYNKITEKKFEFYPVTFNYMQSKGGMLNHYIRNYKERSSFPKIN